MKSQRVIARVHAIGIVVTLTQVLLLGCNARFEFDVPSADAGTDGQRQR